tara:strand:+ start:200 stop:433 length:234 start_codon:yes stop_codon:yes gene_type:complete
MSITLFHHRKEQINSVYHKDEITQKETITLPKVINTDIGSKLLFGNITNFGDNKTANATINYCNIRITNEKNPVNPL